MTVRDVLAARAGASRNGAIHTWCATTWERLTDHRAAAQELLIANGIDV
jgi:hypothetical protein